MNRRDILKILILIFFTIIGSYFAAQFIYQNGKSAINISTSLPNVRINIDGSAINTGETYVKPGRYIISGTKDGYYEYRKTIDINQNKIDVVISLVQKPDAIINVFELTTDEYKKLQINYPIIDSLPYEDALYKISYIVIGSKINGYKIEFTIDSQNATGRRQAMKQLGNLVDNPLDYKINFLNFVSEVK